MFCKHQWEVISETTTESKYESSIKAARSGGASRSVTMPWQMCDAERKHILVIACKKCGNLKRFVETI